MLIGKNYAKISFEFMGLEWLEPMAILTNLLMCSVAMFAFIRLKNRGGKSGSETAWRSFFLLYALAGFTSAFSHGLYNYIGFAGKIPAWGFGVLSVMVLEMIMLYTLKPGNKMLSGFSVIKAATVLTLAFSGEFFLPVAINAVLGLLVIVAPLAMKFTRNGIPGYRNIWLGVSLLIPAAVLYLGKINPHPWMNKDDVSHILMAITIYLFYKSAYAILPATSSPMAEATATPIPPKPTADKQ